MGEFGGYQSQFSVAVGRWWVRKVKDLGNFVQGIMYKVPSTKRGKRCKKLETRSESREELGIKYIVPSTKIWKKTQASRLKNRLKLQDIKIDTRFKTFKNRHKICVHLFYLWLKKLDLFWRKLYLQFPIKLAKTIYNLTLHFIL